MTGFWTHAFLSNMERVGEMDDNDEMKERKKEKKKKIKKGRSGLTFWSAFATQNETLDCKE